MLIREDNVPRLKWEMGVIVKLIKSKDGIVRSAEIKTPKNVRSRPIQRLHVLQFNGEQNMCNSQDDVSNNNPIVTEVPTLSDRPKRDVKKPKFLEHYVTD